MLPLLRRHPFPLFVTAAFVVAATGLSAIVSSGPPRGGDAGQEHLVPLPPPRSGQARLTAYRGLGTWIDIFDSSWSNARRSVREMKRRGVRTLFLQTSNFHRGGAFAYPERTERFIDAAAGHDIRVVAWYLPGFRDVQEDLGRTMAAINLTTDRGNSFDSFGLDIESSEVRDAGRRTDRLLRLSRLIREEAGGSYPLGAIVPSPRGVLHNPTYWPGFPWAELTSYYDVYVPMTYFTWRVSGERAARWYTESCLRILREETGNPAFPVHMIGGIADEASVGETRGFVRVVRERSLLGASYYTFPLTRDEQWRVLGSVPVRREPSAGQP